MTLTFELWRTEYVVPAGECVEVAHPTVWKDGQLMPVTAARRPPRYGPPEGWEP